METHEHGAERDGVAIPEHECDLVMKGGITSGVVYPSAVLALKGRYRFRKVGGASVGAIAAALTAAAEHGRPAGGFEALEGLVAEIQRPGRIVGLFQPIPQAKAAFELLVHGAERSRRPLWRLAMVGGVAVLRTWWIGLVGVLMAIGIGAAAVIAVRSAPPAPVAVALSVAAVLAILVVLASTAVAAVLWRALRLRGHLEKPENGFGICPGVRQPGHAGPALTEWLHGQLQRCAGLPEDGRPLTFADLASKEISFDTITTDLGHARPVRLPLRTASFLFRPDEFGRLFPRSVVEHLVAAGSRLLDEDRRLPAPRLVEPPAGYCYLPTADLPVLVAARLSLSFPILISAVPLHLLDGAGNPQRTWMSDGGISSNFPIHFYDAWLPTRPTFGLDFQPFPGELAPAAAHLREAGGQAAGDDPESVRMFPQGPSASAPLRWDEVNAIGPFVRQILDTMQNWRDTLQADLPGFRERVCHVRLRPTEGGLNLGMGPEVIEGLARRGELAGETILESFPPGDGPRWRQHVFTRYLLLMEQLQARFGQTREGYAGFSEALAAGLPEVEFYRVTHDADWCRLADRVTNAFLQDTAHWAAPPAGKIDFSGEDADMPRPSGVLRLTPDV